MWKRISNVSITFFWGGGGGRWIFLRDFIRIASITTLGKIKWLSKKNQFKFNMSLVISYRKPGLRCSLSASERAKVIKMKAQMEQQIQALEEQINFEKLALTARKRSQTLRYKDFFILNAYP